jgi:hypothetical protein
VNDEHRTLRPKRALRRVAVAAAVATVFTLPTRPSAARGLDFAQIEASSDSSSVVLVRALGEPQSSPPAPLATATATGWHDGEAVALGAVWRRELGATGVITWRAGLGGGVDHFASRADGDRTTRDGASLRGQLEAEGPLSDAGNGWRGYALLQASTFRGQWFATLQAASPAHGGVELSRYKDETYRSTTLVARFALDRVVGTRGWSLRVGAVHDDAGTRALLGIGYNGF